MTFDIGAATNFGGGNDEISGGDVLDTTRIIVAHFDATNEYPLATVLERSGATINAGTTVNPDGTNTGFRITHGIAALTSSLAHYCFTKDATPDVSYVRRMTISGTTITLGNTLTLPFNTLYPMAICALTSTKSLLLYVDTGFQRLYGRVLTDDGTDITAGAEQGSLDQTMHTTRQIDVISLSSSLVCALYTKAVGGGLLGNAIYTVSGDTITLDDGTTAFPGTSQFFAAEARAHQITSFSTTKWVVGYSVASNDNKIAVVEDTGSLVIGTPLQLTGAGDYFSALAANVSDQITVLVRAPLRMVSYTESSRALSSNSDDTNVPNSTSPSAGTPVAGYIGQVDTGQWILATWDSNTEAQGYQASPASATVSVNTITLASSPQSLSVDVNPNLSTLTLASSAEFITHNPVALFTITLVSSPESLDVIPVPLATLTLVSSPEVILIGQAFGVDVLTLASSPQALTVVPGGAIIVCASVTLVGTPQSFGSLTAPVTVTMATLTLASVGSAVPLARVQVYFFLPAELTNLRDTSHKSDLRLTIFAPPILWTGRVAGVHNRGDTVITYDGGSGSLTFVRAGLQLWVGTAPGLGDIDKNRLDDVGSMLLATGSFVTDENGTVWEEDQYLSIKHLFPVERVNPRLFGGVLYKFYDVAYVAQNGQDDTDPVCIAGSDQVGDLVAGSLVFNMDLSDSYATTGGVISSYALSVAPTTGAVVSFNTGTGIGTVTVSQAGYWWAICSCTDSFGNLTERFVFLRAHDANDTDFIKVKITGYQENWGGGVSISVEGRTDVLLSDIPDNAIALLWYDNYFDGVSGYVSIFRRDDGRSNNLLFDGYVRKDTGRDDFATGDGSVTFNITTVDGLMANLPMRGIPLRINSSPSDWYEYQLLTTGEAIWFLFRWHTTVHTRHDILGIRTFDSTQYRAAADFEEGSIFGMVNRVAFERGVIAKITCDRLGRIHFVQDSQLLNQSGRDALTNVISFTENDVGGVINTVRDPEQKTYTMQLSGFSYDNSGDGTPFISIIPAYRPSGTTFSVPERRGGSVRNVPTQLVESQQDANERVGRFYATDNREIKEFRIPFRGNYLGALTTIPSVGFYELDIANTSLARQLDINKIRLICRSIQASDDQGYLSVTGVFEPEAIGPDGIQGNYPSSMADPLVPDAAVDQALEVEEASEAAFVTQSTWIRRTYPVAIADATWTSLDATDFLHGVIDPWWEVINNTSDPDSIIWWSVGVGVIEYTDRATGTTTDVTPTNDPPNTWSDGVAPTVANLSFVEILGDRFIQNRFYVLAEWQEAGGDWRSWVAYTSDYGVTWNWLDFYDGYTLLSAARGRNLTVNGTYLLAVLWENTATGGMEYLRAYRKSDFIGVYRELMNNSSRSDDQASVQSCKVTTVVDDDSLWFVFGCVRGGFYLESTIFLQIIVSVDAGVTWTLYQKWKADKCVGLRVGDADDIGQRPVWAWRV